MFLFDTTSALLVIGFLRNSIRLTFLRVTKMSLAIRIVDEIYNIAPLRMSALSPRTFRDYSIGTRDFVSFLKIDNPNASSVVDLDKSLCPFGVYLYDLNLRRGCLQHFRYALFGTIFFLPELKLHLGRSRQLEKGWDRTVPASSPPPLPLTTVNAISAWLASQDRFCESLALNIGFHGFLRANEICKLQKSDICFPGDFRLSDFHSSRAGCVGRHAKTGKNQFIPLTDDTLLRRLRRFSNSLPHHTPDLFSISYSSLTSTFKEVLHHFHLGKVGYTLHSLRHGGATYQWLNGSPFEDVMLKGR